MLYLSRIAEYILRFANMDNGAGDSTSWFSPATYQVSAARERSGESYPWISPTYQVNATSANVALLPVNQSPVYTPYLAQSYSTVNQAGVPVTSRENEEQSRPPTVDFSIKVVNPQRKRDAKTFILKGVQLSASGSLQSLREEILEELGKTVVSFELKFDVGYMSGNQRICFREKDDIGSQLLKLAKSGSHLWCEGLCPLSVKRKRSASSVSILIEDSSSSYDDTRPAKTQKSLRQRNQH